MFPAAPFDAGEEYDYRAEVTESELLWRRADIIPAGRWSLYQHLMDTHAVLEAWDQPPSVQLAGLLHGAYDVHAGGITLFDVSERATVRSLIGDEAEAIVFFAHRTPRETLLMSGSTGVGADARLSADAATLQLAVLAQSCSENGAPTAWLATAARLAAVARNAEVVPPPFAHSTVTVSVDDERALLDAYEVLCGCDDLFGADERRANAVAATERVPWVAEPLIRRGMLSLAAGDTASATALGERSRDLLTMWNVAWDKRLSPIQWLALADFLRATAPLTTLDVGFLSTRVRELLRSTAGVEGLHAQLESCGALGTLRVNVDVRDDLALDDVHAGDVWADFQLMPARFSRYLSGLRDPNAPERMAMYPEIAARPWWDPDEVQAADVLERGASDIIAEFIALDPDAFAAGDGDGRLRIVRLIEAGRPVESAAMNCPKTIELLRSCGSVENSRGTAFFAILAPQTETPHRRSRTNVGLRCCLGLSPEGAFGLEVDRIRERLRFRRCLIFDESYTHREWNTHNAECAMLVVQLWHPELTAAEIELLDGWNRTVAYEATRLNRAQQLNEVSYD